MDPEEEEEIRRLFLDESDLDLHSSDFPTLVGEDNDNVWGPLEWGKEVTSHQHPSMAPGFQAGASPPSFQLQSQPLLNHHPEHQM